MKPSQKPRKRRYSRRWMKSKTKSFKPQKIKSCLWETLSFFRRSSRGLQKDRKPSAKLHCAKRAVGHSVRRWLIMLRPVPSRVCHALCKKPQRARQTLPVSKRAASIAQGPARTLPSALQLSCITFCPHWQKSRQCSRHSMPAIFRRAAP